MVVSSGHQVDVTTVVTVVVCPAVHLVTVGAQDVMTEVIVDVIVLVRVIFVVVLGCGGCVGFPVVDSSQGDVVWLGCGGCVGFPVELVDSSQGVLLETEVLDPELDDFVVAYVVVVEIVVP